ncbi:hypothetical protein BpHYR1_037190 [Brachionus plicatilis]|uniref:Uncharacterized protein n=1 Tax=Brachionus plicatilis TaxID=10195 RepID=A0A3M7SI25_BRAPC|nr:hypothetical protein BpHYR1_037190 [Brachionus plicatilis]
MGSSGAKCCKSNDDDDCVKCCPAYFVDTTSHLYYSTYPSCSSFVFSYFPLTYYSKNIRHSKRLVYEVWRAHNIKVKLILKQSSQLKQMIFEETQYFISSSQIVNCLFNIPCFGTTLEVDFVNKERKIYSQADLEYKINQLRTKTNQILNKI